MGYPREHRIVHPRVAHILQSNNWAYVHEYRASRGFFDFLAIHRDAHVLAIIECKCAITSVSDLIFQMNQYHQTLRVKAAAKIVFTLKPPSANAVKRLRAQDIKVYGINIDDPIANAYSGQEGRLELNALMKRYHVVEAAPVFEEVPLPPFVDISGLRPGIWPKNPHDHAND